MDEIANNVTLMTLHASKGLEFPTVFIAGCDEGIFPSARCSNTLSELEEERRLMYVGVTRAETKLYLTTANRRQMWGEYKYYTPSRFIEEIPANLIDEEASTQSEYSDRSTFRSAVKSVSRSSYNDSSKKYSNSKNSEVSSASFTSDGFVKPVRGFGANFVAPGVNSVAGGKANKTTDIVRKTPARAIIKKNHINKEREEEKIKKFFEDNVMKRRLEEKKREDERLAKEQEIAK
jgi:DNA helicase-2/ATP-dependent DNA helicase PcrA